MRWSLLQCVLLTGTMLLPFPAAGAGPTPATDLDAEIVNHCHYRMGEFGVDMVSACVEQDLSALKALEQYPAEFQEIVARCAPQAQQYGWVMVKNCADRDIQAEAALAQYGEERAASLEKCRKQMGRRGAAKVKECVDKDPGSEAATK